GFSISATSRAPRGEEQNGREYYFLTPDEFKRKIDANEFVEWEEVYAGTCYGTLRSEVERVTSSGRNLIMDIDVKGGINVKKQFGERALALFILPPSIETLEKRLRERNTDSEDSIRQRISKAEFEIGFSSKFDCQVINDDLERAVNTVDCLIKEFIER
ncbi:MAG: guanylate kinase, partial [Muribaculaceae bacterium]|nr:guanylate kinase [Muribaculaceae bacterium]